MRYSYRLLNVFALPGQSLSGNPLCVFEDARGLEDDAMQALARQFNLSETTFILPSETATARVRIFTPDFEMPFAGHPTLGTAHVVRDITAKAGALTLEMQAGVIAVTVQHNDWTLQANAPQWRKVEASRAQLAAMLSLDETDIGDSPRWINAGSEQLLVPLTSPDAVARARPSFELLRRHAALNEKRFLVYVFAAASEERIVARFFFAKADGVVEDPATGSACANLGGWFIATETTLPFRRQVEQGAFVKRPSRLGLRVDGEGHIFVSGHVIELGRGVIEL